MVSKGAQLRGPEENINTSYIVAFTVLVASDCLKGNRI